MCFVCTYNAFYWHTILTGFRSRNERALQLRQFRSSAEMCLELRSIRCASYSVVCTLFNGSREPREPHSDDNFERGLRCVLGLAVYTCVLRTAPGTGTIFERVIREPRRRLQFCVCFFFPIDLRERACEVVGTAMLMLTLLMLQSPPPQKNVCVCNELVATSVLHVGVDAAPSVFRERGCQRASSPWTRR